MSKCADVHRVQSGYDPVKERRKWRRRVLVAPATVASQADARLLAIRLRWVFRYLGEPLAHGKHLPVGILLSTLRWSSTQVPFNRHAKLVRGHDDRIPAYPLMGPVSRWNRKKVQTTHINSRTTMGRNARQNVPCSVSNSYRRPHEPAILIMTETVGIQGIFSNILRSQW